MHLSGPCPGPGQGSGGGDRCGHFGSTCSRGGGHHGPPHGLKGEDRLRCRRGWPASTVGLGKSAANCFVVVAGMEGALPSVIAGLVDGLVVAVPTSIGYGTSFGGLVALLGMLNSCAPGLSVVNIDNGFGAGYMAGLLDHM